jgi:hypothetical protein
MFLLSLAKSTGFLTSLEIGTRSKKEHPCELLGSPEILGSLEILGTSADSVFYLVSY